MKKLLSILANLKVVLSSLIFVASCFVAVMFVDAFWAKVLVVLVGYFLMKISYRCLSKHSENKKDFEPISGRFLIGNHWFEGYNYFFEILLDGSCVYTFKWSDESSCRKYKSNDFPFKTKASEKLIVMLEAGKYCQALSEDLKDLKQKLLEEFLEIKEAEKLRKQS